MYQLPVFFEYSHRKSHSTNTVADRMSWVLMNHRGASQLCGSVCYTLPYPTWGYISEMKVNTVCLELSGLVRLFHLSQKDDMSMSTFETLGDRLMLKQCL